MQGWQSVPSLGVAEEERSWLSCMSKWERNRLHDLQTQRESFSRSAQVSVPWDQLHDHGWSMEQRAAAHFPELGKLYQPTLEGNKHARGLGDAVFEQMQNAVNLVIAMEVGGLTREQGDNIPLLKSIPELQLTRTHSSCLSTGVGVAKLLI